jgi:hypothetical protein
MSTLAITAEVLVAALFLSTANEKLVGLFDKVWEKIPIENVKAYVSFIAGALISFLFQIDLVSPMIPTTPLYPWAGALLSALIVGRGSNLIHDLYPTAK